MYFNRKQSIEKVNFLTSQSKPFLVLSDFLGENNFIESLEGLDREAIKFDFSEKERKKDVLEYEKIFLQKFPIPFSQYKSAFDYVQQNIFQGNSFLTNLTAETPITLNISLLEIFERSEAKYKIYVKDKFVCFSPETFINIDAQGKISSFPMKGTIDANLFDAENVIMSDKKELHEHTTIVDLIRNDVSMVAEKVWVEKFRYIDRITKEDGQELLQVSSQVSGSLSSDWKKDWAILSSQCCPLGRFRGLQRTRLWR